MLDMIRAVSTSDREFREGYNEVVRSPTSYEDQLLQQEASLDVDGIKKYNEERKKEKDDEEDKKKQQQAEEAKPRWVGEASPPRQGSHWVHGSHGHGKVMEFVSMFLCEPWGPIEANRSLFSDCMCSGSIGFSIRIIVWFVQSCFVNQCCKISRQLLHEPVCQTNLL